MRSLRSHYAVKKARKRLASLQNGRARQLTAKGLGGGYLLPHLFFAFEKRLEGQVLEPYTAV